MNGETSTPATTAADKPSDQPDPQARLEAFKIVSDAIVKLNRADASMVLHAASALFLPITRQLPAA